MIGFEAQLELFKLIGGKLKRKMECLAIGGSAMLFYNLKSATKDVDMVFFSEAERREFARILSRMGFSKRRFKKRSGKNLPVVMERKETTFDIFAGGLFDFRISPGIRERVREKHEFGNLVMGIVSPEDIILLKSVTDREGDRLDARNIAEKMNINWDMLISEALWQSQNGKKAFMVYLFDFMEDLKDDMGADIPKGVIRKVRKLSEEEMLRMMDRKK